MEVITNKKDSFLEEYKAGDLFYQPSEDLCFILMEYDGEWQLISLDGNDGRTYNKYGESDQSVEDWVGLCLTDYTRYPKSDYQLILRQKDMD